MSFTLKQCRTSELADSIKSNIDKGYLVSVKSDGVETATYKLFKVDYNIPYPNNTKTAGLFFGVMTFNDFDDAWEYQVEKVESGYSVSMRLNKDDNIYTLTYRAQ